MQINPSRSYKHFAKIIGALAFAVVLSGCVAEVGPGGHSHGWCWWHPNACRR